MPAGGPGSLSWLGDVFSEDAVFTGPSALLQGASAEVEGPTPSPLLLWPSSCLLFSHVGYVWHRVLQTGARRGTEVVCFRSCRLRSRRQLLARATGAQIGRPHHLYSKSRRRLPRCGLGDTDHPISGFRRQGPGTSWAPGYPAPRRHLPVPAMELQ